MKTIIVFLKSQYLGIGTVCMSSLFLIIFWSKLSLLSSTIITVNIRKVVYQKTFTLNRTEYVTPQSLPPHRGEGMTMKFLSYF